MKSLLASYLLAVTCPLGFGAVTPPESSSSSIDRLVSAKIAELGITPAPVCQDSVFIRRVYLDTLGILPDIAEVQSFLSDTRPNKRSELINKLLLRDEFADYQTMYWANVLRIKSEFPINLWPNAAESYYQFIHDNIRRNTPFNRFAYELITANGSNMRRPQANFFRAVQHKTPEGIAEAVCLTFMGVRYQRLSTAQQKALSAFFSRIGYKTTAEWKEEIVFFDIAKALSPLSLTFPDGQHTTLSATQDPRIAFAQWLVSPKNPFFAKCLVNRVWAQLFGRGIICPPDDIRADNPPSDPKLLRYLESAFIASGYDVKSLFRLILHSQTYQRDSVIPQATPSSRAAFAYYVPRKLEAEVLIDAINQVTATHEAYISRIPEPFTYMPTNQRAVTLTDVGISSPFLELFGRSTRNTGLISEQIPPLSTSAQQLHMLNSTHIRQKIETSKQLATLINRYPLPADIVNALSLLILSRPATPDEQTRIARYLATAKTSRKEALLDIVWAYLNGAEFQFNH